MVIKPNVLKKPSDLKPIGMAIRPQIGPQELALSSPADILIYGGAAGSGKSYGLLLEPLRHVIGNKDFAAVFFRRNTTQIRNPGGLWDESMKLYPLIGGIPVTSPTLLWKWKEGGKIQFSHLEHESTVHDWQGSQIPLIGFDELTHFTEQMFFYMLSRNRSVSGVKPYIRATCNPDADSWVAKLIEWWIDQETGYPILERSGKIRWFIRLNDMIIWADTKQELISKYPGSEPKSLTFVAAKLDDNKELLKRDPSYRSNLLALSRVERERLLHGNWKIRPQAGMYFKRSEARIVDTIPDDLIKVVRRWDFAATEPSETNPNPDWTSGTKMGLRRNGRWIILDNIHVQKRASEVRELVKRTAEMDGFQVKIGISQDPGQAGKEQAETYVAHLAGFSVEAIRESGDKVTRAEPYAAQWQVGNVDLLRGAWNEEFLVEHELFGDGKSHDDQVDSASGAFLMLTGSSLSTWERLGR